MQIIITGANGQLGRDLIKILSSNGNEYEIIALSKNECDITQKDELSKALEGKDFSYLINAAAYTNVEKAESEIQTCNEVNNKGVQNLIFETKNRDATFIQISTDYVFDGTLNRPYVEKDITNPLSVYGKSKREAEIEVSNYQKHFIIRTSWLFGINGNNFVDKIILKAKAKEELNIVDDQVGSPTYTIDLAARIQSLIQRDLKEYGIYHVTNEGYVSWYQFAKEIINKMNLNHTINPVKSSQFKTAAQRPHNSRLSNKKINMLLGFKMPSWDDALARYLIELEGQE